MNTLRHAEITGWGESLPPAVLTNSDLATFLDTSDEWIVQRTGISERRIGHVSGIEMATVASKRALACAGLDPADLDLIIYGSCSNDEQVPNSASGVQIAIGANRAAAMDLNTACTSFLYGLASAAGMIQSGMIRSALVIGVELISQFMDWSNRNVAVLFGDGAAAVVLQATDEPVGVLGTVLGCDADARQTLRVRGMGCDYARGAVNYGDTLWDFDGQAIFKRAVNGMSNACAKVIEEAGVSAGEIELVVPHQANLRIIEAVAKYAGVEMDRVMLTVKQYGNMSAATMPVALVEALKQGRVKPGSLLLMPGFGAGLTYGAMLLRWGQRVTPLFESDAELAECNATGLELVNAIRARQDPNGHSRAGLFAPEFAENR